MNNVVRQAEWDPTLPTCGQLLGLCWTWSTATRLRRFTVLPMFMQLCVIGVALTLPAEAQAAAFGTQSPLLMMLQVTDSYGVPVSRYALSTDYGSVLDGGTQAVLATLLQFEASIFISIAGFAVWILSYTVGLGFLPHMVSPLADEAQAFAGQIIPGVAAIAAVIAALFVAINIMRGHTARAASQSVAAIVIAMIAGALIHAPISWVISPDGPLMQGRNVAVSLASNSTSSSANATQVLANLEGVLATHFIRTPLQTFNFGGIPDLTPGCAAAWSDGVNSGDTDRIKDNVSRCGAPDSAAMKATADHPNPGQLGTGAVLIIFSCVFGLFCLVLAWHIVAEFFRAVANAVRLMLGLAIGVIPGVAQSQLINTFVAVIFSGVAMFAYITLAVFVGHLVGVIFDRTGNGIIGMCSSLLLMMMAVGGVFKVSRALKKGSAATTSSILSGIGAPPAPPPTNILAEKSSAFLRTTATLGTEIAGTMAGVALASRIPAVGNALQFVNPYMTSNRMMRNVARGAAMHQHAAAESSDDDINGEGPPKPPPASPPPGPQGPPSGGPPPTGGGGSAPPPPDSPPPSPPDPAPQAPRAPQAPAPATASSSSAPQARAGTAQVVGSSVIPAAAPSPANTASNASNAHAGPPRSAAAAPTTGAAAPLPSPAPTATPPPTPLTRADNTSPTSGGPVPGGKAANYPLTPVNPVTSGDAMSPLAAPPSPFEAATSSSSPARRAPATSSPAALPPTPGPTKNGRN